MNASAPTTVVAQVPLYGANPGLLERASAAHLQPCEASRRQELDKPIASELQDDSQWITVAVLIHSLTKLLSSLSQNPPAQGIKR